MDTFAPEFSRFWLPATEGEGVHAHDAGPDDVRNEQKALEELAERVTAARSVI